MKPNNDLEPLNGGLYTEFSVQELEQRLETDPLIFSALFDARSGFECPDLEKCKPLIICDLDGCSHCTDFFDAT